MAETLESLKDTITGYNLGNVSSNLGSIDEKLKAWEDFFNDFKKNLNCLWEALTTGKTLDTFFELLGKMFAKILRAFVDGVARVGDQLADAVKECSETIGEIWNAILKRLLEAFESLEAFPRALTTGPLAALDAAGELFSLLTATNPSFDLPLRIEAVVGSIDQLLDLMGGRKKDSLPIVQLASEKMKTLLTDAIAGGDSNEKLRKLLFEMLVPDDKAVVKLLQSAAAGKWWAWADLPTGLTPGGLHDWINDESSYVDTSGRPLNKSQKLLARRFRTQCVMSIDGYLRTRIDPGSALAGPDGRMSYQSLTDVIALLIEQVVSFVFEPEDYPVGEEGLDGFEDVGLGFATSIARQMRVAIRGLLGTLFRGIWEYSFHSDALCELISTIVGTLFSALLDGIIRNVTWTLRLVSRYSGDPYGGAEGAGFVVGGFDRTSPPSGAGIAEQSVEYVAFVRSNGLVVGMPPMNAKLTGVMQDLAAYLDSAYLHFPRSARPALGANLVDTCASLHPAAQQFLDVRVFPSVARDTISAVNPQLVGHVLKVEASCGAVGDDFGHLPRAVLRAYFGNTMVVMAPAKELGDPYVMEHTFTKAPRRDFRITVLSNRGGMNSATCTIP